MNKWQKSSMKGNVCNTCSDTRARRITAAATVITHRSEFQPRCLFSDKPRSSTLLRRVLTLTLAVSLLAPALEPGRERPRPPARGLQRTASLATATCSNLGMKYSRTPMTQRYTGPPARSHQPLPFTSLIRQKAGPGSSRAGRISSFLVVMHGWWACPQNQQIRW